MFLRKILQPLQSPGWDPFTNGDGYVDRMPLLLDLVENHDHLSVIRLKPVRQGATLDDPAAVEVTAWVAGAIFVVVTAFVRAMGARCTGIYMCLPDCHLYPAIAAGGTRVALSDPFFRHHR